MSRIRLAVGAVTAAALVTCATIDRGKADAGLASAWTDVHQARARLVAGPAANAKSGAAYLAGLEVTLADGWKTYWRMPGDAGVPPQFDWADSSNVAELKVLYPAPSRMHEAGAETIGYKGQVIFPVEVVPADASKPIDLKLALEFGICRQICIPAQLALSLTLPPARLTGTPLPALTAALDRVPRLPASRRATDPELKRVTATLEGAEPGLKIDARFAEGDRGGDLFVEAPDGLYVPMSKRLPDAADGTARFEVSLARGGNAPAFKGKTLTLTLVGDAGASETTWVVPGR